MPDFTHIDEKGRAAMVDVSGKAATRRTAQARGSIRMSAECFTAVRSETVPKGDVFAAARIAGIMAAKKTPDLIPLCHPLFLTGVRIEFQPDPDSHSIHVLCETSCTERTGVEMEALAGVSAALLTIYDMCKALDRTMVMTDICVVSKDGGRSGPYRRNGVV